MNCLMLVISFVVFFFFVSVFVFIEVFSVVVVFEYDEFLLFWVFGYLL